MNTEKGFVTPIVIAVIAILAIGGGTYVYTNQKNEEPNASVNSEVKVVTESQVSTSQNTTSNTPRDTQTDKKTTVSVNATTDSNIQTSIDVKTVDWQIHDSGRGIEFKHPSYISVDKTTNDSVLLSYSQGGKNYFNINIKESTQSLEEDVQATVAIEKANSAQAAAPVTVTSKAHAIGSINGYLITRQSGNASLNTTAMFKMKEGNKIVTFVYSYQGYIFSKNLSDLTGGAPITAEFQSDLQAKLKVYNDIQAIISTFRFTR